MMKLNEQPRKNFITQLETIVNQSLERLNLPQSSGIRLERPANREHGDYASNAAMIIFGELKKSDEVFAYSNPRELAEAIAEDIKSQNHVEISEVSVAGPGFVNFSLTDRFFTAKIGEMASNLTAALPVAENHEKIIVEYSSPNIAKPFTVGHLRSTIIGDAIANLLEAAGHTVYRDNHIGDWGTQFGKQIYAIKTWGDEEQIEQAENPLKELVALYVKFHQEAEINPKIEDKGREWFTKLENGDEEARRLWQRCINWSWKEFEKIYDRLGVTFTENEGRGYGESFFEDKMDDVVAELKEKGLLKESEGAQLVFFPNEEYPPLMILKKDGSTLYATRDLATDKFRKEHYGNDITVINETGSEQNLYFQQIIRVEEMLGWYKPSERVHIGHGLIRFKDGKMSTRKGNVIWLQDVLNMAYEKVEEISGDDLSEEAKWKIAVGALKWNDLKRSPHLAVTFDWDEVVSIKGNSGPYMQYAHVRAQSIFETAAKKWGINPADIESYVTEHIDILLNLLTHSKLEPEPIEKQLLRNLFSYYETFNHSLIEYSPHYLANYLHELAQTFNTFYNKHQVVSDLSVEDKKKNLESTGSAVLPEVDSTTHFRLLLTLATAKVIASGLEVLGIETVDRM